MQVDDSELDAAVAAGRLSPSDAQALRRFVTERRAAPPPIARDTHFRYIGSEGGLGVALALVILWPVLAAALIGSLGGIGGIPIAIGAWLLARRFAERRQGAPTTLLFLVFVIHAAIGVLGLLGVQDGVSPAQGVVVAGSCAAFSFGFWARFRLPIAFAAGLLAALTIGDHLLIAATPDAPGWVLTLWMLASAVAVFLVAMWWDLTDVYRQTIRADIAWWLHGLAALKLCAGGARAIVGVRDGAVGWEALWSPPAQFTPASAALLLVLLTAYAAVAIAIDRRPLLLFGAIFLVPALTALAGPMLGPVAILLAGGLAIAAALHWQRLRRVVLSLLPTALRAQLPRTAPTFLWDRPVA